MATTVGTNALIGLPAAQNPLTLAEDHLANSIARSQSFIAATSESNWSQALKHVFVDSPPPPKNGDAWTREEVEQLGLGVFAVVGTSEENGWRLDSVAVGTHKPAGLLAYEIWRLNKEGESNDAILYRIFKNMIGNIAVDIANGGEGHGVVARPDIALVSIMRNKESKHGGEGDWMWGQFQVLYGGDGGGV